MAKVLEKVERRLGERLFLKGDRCASPKCALVRRSYPPGPHGTGRGRGRRRESSEYGVLSREKQKIRFLYGLDNKGVRSYSMKASQQEGIFASRLFTLLERRLDNVLFRLGLADSRRSARQLIVHGHVFVQGKSMRSPSYQVHKDDVISLKEATLASPLFARAHLRLKNYTPPAWLILDKTKRTGSVVRLPEEGDFESTFDAAKIKEFYSR
ncbi:MAG: 30S ribosomal protein S4 [Candidatus Sungbacteria bacterium]|nr:30S ribosomal protein S4 [Candidatus Sungbacteria bacterium]